MEEFATLIWTAHELASRDSTRDIRDSRPIPLKISISIEQFCKKVARSFERAEVRSGARNAVFSVADQLATPTLMLFAAPFLLARLGLEEFGIWMLVLALTGSLSVFNFGLGDATIKFISERRGARDTDGINRTFHANLMLGVLLGALSAAGIVAAAPLCARVFMSARADAVATTVCSFRVGGVILALRSVDSILANTLRGFEEYAAAAKVSIGVKCGTIASAVALVSHGHGVLSILETNAVWIAAGILAYAVRVRRVLPQASFWPKFDRTIGRKITSFGIFAWLQSLAAMLFTQADKLIVGGLMGAAAAGRYSVCTQLAAMVHMIVASAFGFLFPRFSRQHEAGELEELKHTFRRAMAVNWAFAGALALPLLFGGHRILTLWLGRAFADESSLLLAVLVFGYLWLSINVVPYLALLGLGRVRYNCVVGVLGGCASACASAFLIPRYGLLGAGFGKIVYGAVVTLCYFEAAKLFSPGTRRLAALEPGD
jgi:O-antigen/teichoic acid export membrane protein